MLASWAGVVSVPRDHLTCDKQTGLASENYHGVVVVVVVAVVLVVIIVVMLLLLLLLWCLPLLVFYVFT